ncbi:pre-rRNA 2'-O-ribose RNA methyltransferase FTSJ3-like [Artemia franciscana]|uniref:Putative rRNA methyltransferase n=2 Tax=Artemia franciscana TaxID=6661 RepID=A0AA88LAE8_ARTSF|nr:hypothetical protein QYM36_001739 [Artemia franciscana]
MAKKTKVKGKSRQDKYYFLAKETGYRSRSSFKLLQLNRKFDFLPKCRVCIDLCAAPGGWMQVAKQQMPVSSLIIGVDLFPIRPIPGCVALQEDITTEKCRQSLKAELKSWKADVILHDGAPNVGQNWIHDAFVQNQLVLSALKLATQFLQKGGWFITKIFRSKDYQSLIWVLSQLFKKVQSTKPQASRLETAEIFVVCQGYKAPDQLDPRFLDPKHVFKEIESEQTLTKAQPRLGEPLPKKPQKEGYEDGKLNLYRPISAMNFIQSENYLDILANASEIILDDERIANHPSISTELRECFKDIQVLGKKDIRELINWRKALKKELDKEIKAENVEPEKEEEIESEGENEEEKGLKELDAEIEEMKAEKQRELKKQKRRILKERKKLAEKMKLDMVIPGDMGPMTEELSLFELKVVKDENELQKVTEHELDSDVEDDDDLGDVRATKKKVKWARPDGVLDDHGLFYKNKSDEEEEGSEVELASDDETLGLKEDFEPMKKMSKSQLRKQNKQHPLITDLEQGDPDARKKRKAEAWFEQDLFDGMLDDEKDEDMELEMALSVQKKTHDKDDTEAIEVNKPSMEQKRSKSENSKRRPLVLAPSLLENSQSDSNGKDSGIEQESDDDSSSDEEDENKDDVSVSMKPASGKGVGGFEVVSKEETCKIKKRKLCPEELALGTMLIQSKKTRRDLIDDGWNRYMFNDVNLPDWFVNDENQHNKRPPPVTKEMIAQYREELKEANVRTIKKVVEAKARKKQRAMKKMEKVKKKIESISSEMGSNDYDKAQQIRMLYKKALIQKKPKVTYVVSKRNQATSKARHRPKGVEGTYKLVDRRMKADKRGQKAADRRNKKRGKR